MTASRRSPSVLSPARVLGVAIGAAWAGASALAGAEGETRWLIGSAHVHSESCWHGKLEATRPLVFDESSG